MKHIKLKSIHLENFKGVKSFFTSFSDFASVSGPNASGKTTIPDSFLWLLFNIDSRGNSNPPVRPVDEDGKWIDDIEITVEAKLVIDGAETTLKKTQKQVWQTRRGDTTAEYKGDTNTYEVDGFPCSTLKEYNAKVESIVEPKLFKLLTDPTAFNALPEKEQRDILFRFVDDLTDADVMDMEPGKYDPVSQDILAAGSDKAREKAMKDLKALKDEMKAFPIRIDEVMRGKVPALSEEEVLARKAEAETELEIVRNETDNLDASMKSYTDIQDKIVALRIKASEIKSRTEEEYARKKMAARTEVTNALMEVQRLEQKRDRLCDSLSEYKQYIEQGENDIAELSRQYREIKSRVMPEDETICPTCGRPFESERIEEIRSDFEKRKDRDLGRIGTRGKGIRSNVNAYKEKMSAAEKEIASLTEQVAQADAKHKALIEAEKAVIMPDYIMTPEYQKLNKEIIALSEQLDTVDDGTEMRGALKGRETLARQKLQDANDDLSVIENNKRADARVDELREQQRAVGQQVADQEQKVYLIEEFIKAKMNLLSDRINSRFESVRFKLFDRQKNGAIVPCCKMQCNSNGSYVDVGQANHSAVLLGGLDVIASLSKLYEVYAPVFLDNAEAINDELIPRMEQQMILLKVSDDPELTVSNM